MTRLLCFSALGLGLLSAVASQNEVHAQSLIVGRGGVHYNGYGRGYYGGNGQDYRQYGQGYGYGPRTNTYSVYGDGPFGYGAGSSYQFRSPNGYGYGNGDYYNGYGNYGYSNQPYNGGRYSRFGYDSYGNRW